MLTKEYRIPMPLSVEEVRIFLSSEYQVFFRIFLRCYFVI